MTRLPGRRHDRFPPTSGWMAIHLFTVVMPGAAPSATVDEAGGGPGMIISLHSEAEMESAAIRAIRSALDAAASAAKLKQAGKRKRPMLQRLQGAA